MKSIVIMDNNGNFVGNKINIGINNGEFFYLYRTGNCDGFSGYTNIERAEKKLEQLQAISDKYEFGLVFSLQIINDADIPEGEVIVKKLFAKENVA